MISSTRIGLDKRVLGYQYDGAGNLLADTTGGYCGGGAKYGWDAESHMTCFGTYRYTCNGDGERVAKSSGTMYVAGLSEADGNGNMTNDYIFLGSQRVARVDIASGNVYYFLGDSLGSSAMVVDAQGNIQNESDYWPFGVEHVVTQKSSDQKFKYTVKERDAESGLDYFGARYYGSNMGRFMSPDPSGLAYASLANPQSFNLYSYVRNNPLINTDPSGEECVWDDGSYDAADDPDTGNADGCTSQGGTYIQPENFENSLLTNGQMSNVQYGSWSSSGSSVIQSSWLGGFFSKHEGRRLDRSRS